MANTHLSIPNFLYILPFDHQTGLFKELDWTLPITHEQIEIMKQIREIIYRGYQYGISLGIPVSQTALLTDTLYGSSVITDAQKKHYPVIQTMEKSGQPVFIFNDENWQDSLVKNTPNYVKALVRYNPSANSDNLQISRENLKKLSDFSQEQKIPFMIEPLVTPTDEQKSEIDFDHRLRPALTVQMIHEIYNANIYPAIWKIEGSDDKEFYNTIAATINLYDSSARIIILGRNETIEKVCTWLTAGAINDHVIGFAIGRTVFLDSIKQWVSGSIDEQKTITTIGENYYHFYQVFHTAKQ